MTAPQDQAGSLSQQGNLVMASGAQTSESVSNASTPASPNPVYSSTSFLKTGSDPQESLFLRWQSVPGASSSRDVTSSSVEVGTSWPGSSQYVAVSQQAPLGQSQYMPASQNQTVYKPLPQVSLNLDQSVAPDKGNLGAQVQGSSSATASRWGSALVFSQGTSQNVLLTQMTHKPVTEAQSSASAVVSSGQAQSPSSSGWPASSGSVSSQPQDPRTQTAPGPMTQRVYKPVIPSQASSQSTVVSRDQSGSGTQITGSVSWPTSTGSMSSQLLSQGTSQSFISQRYLTRKPFKPGFPSQASSGSTTLSGSLGRYGVQSAVSSWPTSSGSVSPQLVSRVTSPYDSVLGAKMDAPSSPAQVSGASTVSQNQSSSAWSASSSLSSQMQGTSSQTIYKPVVSSQGSSPSTVVSQDQVSHGTQSTGSNWSTSSGQLSVLLPSQGQAVGSQTQTSSDSMASQGSSGTQSPGHATWYRVPSGVFGQSNTPMPQYGRVTSSNIPSASEAYSSLFSTLTTSSSSSVPASQPLVPHSGSVVTQYGDASVSQGTVYATSQGPSVSKFQVLKPSSPVSMDVCQPADLCLFKLVQ